jgi:hypothetical protein
MTPNPLRTVAATSANMQANSPTIADSCCNCPQGVGCHRCRGWLCSRPVQENNTKTKKKTNKKNKNKQIKTRTHKPKHKWKNKQTKIKIKTTKIQKT